MYDDFQLSNNNQFVLILTPPKNVNTRETILNSVKLLYGLFFLFY